MMSARRPSSAAEWNEASTVRPCRATCTSDSRCGSGKRGGTGSANTGRSSRTISSTRTASAPTLVRPPRKTRIVRVMPQRYSPTPHDEHPRAETCERRRICSNGHSRFSRATKRHGSNCSSSSEPSSARLAITRPQPMLKEVADDAAVRGNRRLEHHALLEVNMQRWFTDVATTAGEMRELNERAIAVFEQSGDVAGLARAWRHLGYVHQFALRWEDEREALERALVYAQQAQDEREARRIRGGAR